jgi:hypothetical protein
MKTLLIAGGVLICIYLYAMLYFRMAYRRLL